MLGFVSVGIGVRSVHQIVLDTVGCFAILTFLAAGVALVLSRNLSLMYLKVCVRRRN